MTIAFATTRRSAMALLAATAAVAPLHARRPVYPWLYSLDQWRSERFLLAIERDAEVKAIQARIRKDLAASARGKIPSAAATLDRALEMWTRSLIFAEVIHRTSRPFFVWGTDDTPREWMGHKLGGVGTSGDNPDAIYRTAGVEGGGRYEISGRFHPDSRPVQLLFEADAGDMARPQNIMPTAGGKHADIHSASMIDDKTLKVSADGSFRITVSSEPSGGENHMQIPDSGYVMIGVRDMLGKWTDRPCKLSIRRLDRVPAEPWNISTVRARVHESLEGYIRFWSHFPDIWFGGIAANAKSALMERPNGWGFVGGLNFSLKPDEAMLVTTHPGGSKYTGFQLNDPWMIAPDARAKQVCLELSQTTPNADGTVSYVIAKSDPMAANWLDTDGMDDGIGIMRWQQIPAGLKPDGLIRDFRVIKLAEVPGLKLPMVTAEERRRRVAARWADYSSRAT
ncbi:MAG: hypothetical protein AB7F98_06445 [Novosphingobium sp.]